MNWNVREILKKSVTIAMMAAVLASGAGVRGTNVFAEDPDIGGPAEIVPADALDIRLEHDEGKRASFVIPPKFVAEGNSIYLHELELGEHVFLEVDNITEESRIELNGNVLTTNVTCKHGTLSLDVTQHIKKGVNNLDISSGDVPVSSAMGEIRMTTRPKYNVSNVKVVPDVENGIATIYYTANNFTEEEYTGSIEVVISELGLIDDGTPSTHRDVGYAKADITIPAESQITEKTIVKLTNFRSEKNWTITNPFMYEAKVTVDSDSETVSFGMREFETAIEDKQLMLNGEPITVFGAELNVSKMIETYGASLMSSGKFAAGVIAELKTVGINTIKTYGILPECWYAKADEDGILIFTGYIYDETDKRTQQVISKEIITTIDTLSEHPSAVAWEITGSEEASELTKKFVLDAANQDLQQRPVSTCIEIAPQMENSLLQCDVSLLKTDFRLSDINPEVPVAPYSQKTLSWNTRDYSNLKLITNFGEAFILDSEGNTTDASKSLWNTWMPNANSRQRLDEYDFLVRTLAEYWRASGRYVGIVLPYDMIACLTERVENSMKFRSNAIDDIANAFAPVGLSIGYYTTKAGRGEEISFDMMVINDTSEDISNLDVTVKLLLGTTELYSEVKNYDSIRRLGTDGRNIVRRTVNLTIPSTVRDNTDIQMIVSFDYGGKTVKSERSLVVFGGEEYVTPMSGLIVFIAVAASGAVVIFTCIIAYIQAQKIKRKAR